ncbi:hypothetical protein ACRCPS_31545 [Pseudomonas aeruginosa]|nr:hypothetical protein [Pseudomonas saponiphila]
MTVPNKRSRRSPKIQEQGNVLVLRCASAEEHQQMTALIEQLKRKSVRLLNADGDRVTLHILQKYAETPDGSELTFTPGILEAFSGQDAVAPMELLRKMASMAF